LEWIKEYWQKLVAFLAEYDLQKVSDLVREVEWRDLGNHPSFAAVGFALLLYMVFKKRFKTILVLASLVLFLGLVKYTVPPDGGNIPLDKLITFIGGSVILAGANLYVLFMRGD
jgi:hypothetical protein